MNCGCAPRRPSPSTEASCGRGWSDDRADSVLRCASYLVTPESGEDEGGDAAIPYAPASKRRLALSFNATPETLDILRAREALRITPPVDDLAVETDGRRVRVAAKFLSDQVYELSVAQGALKDSQGRALASAFAQRFAFTRDVAGAAVGCGLWRRRAVRSATSAAARSRL